MTDDNTDVPNVRNCSASGLEPEEEFLKRRFGADYISYMTKVRRWL